MLLTLAACGNSNGYKSPDDIQNQKKTEEQEQIADVSVTQSDHTEAVAGEEASDDANIYHALVSNGKPGIIDFNAVWCGPCRQMKPIFHKLAAKYGDKYNFISIDVDQYPEIARKYHIQSIPAFVFIDADGTEGNRITGAVPEEELVNELENPAWF